MNAEFLAVHQREGTTSALASLVRNSRDVYIRAALILDISSKEISRLRELGWTEDICVAPLWPAYDRLCARYRAEIYDPQIQLLPSDQKSPEELWWAWYYHELLPQLLEKPHAVRAVLRGVEAIPCQDPKISLAALESHIAQMTIQPTYYHPTWPAPL